MLFVTNRRLNEGRRSAAGRAVSFDATDSEPGASLFFCRRLGADQYEEVLAAGFFSRLRRSPRRQILLVTHGFNCQPERDIFPRAVELQSLCDRLAPDLVETLAEAFAARQSGQMRPCEVVLRADPIGNVRVAARVSFQPAVGIGDSNAEVLFHGVGAPGLGVGHSGFLAILRLIMQ